jgi:DnaJ-class molecular chaperone
MEDKKLNLDKNCYVIINPSNNEKFALEAGGDRLIIEEDKMRLGFECKTCDGDGFLTEIACGYCKGTKTQDDGQGSKMACRFCCTSRGLTGIYQGQGNETCPDCKGKGALVVIPQTSERRPTSGTIRSKGPDVSKCKECGGTGKRYIDGVMAQQNIGSVIKGGGSTIMPIIVNCLHCDATGKVGLKLEVGDRVIYPIFAGTAITFKQKGTARIMHEGEVMGKIYGIGNIGDLIK